MANDAWARFINFRYGPDGNVFLIDWYDKQACHVGNNVDAWDRTNGRIYKICYGEARPVQPDLRKQTDQELVELQLSSNDWYVRHARRLLQERGGNAAVHAALEKIAFGHADETRRVRGLWALHASGGLSEERVHKGLADKGAYVRAWTIQLALDGGTASPELLHRMAELARTDPSPVVRLYLASGLQRLPGEQRWEVLDGLLAHGEDASDLNLPFMDWYAAEPLAQVDPGRALALAGRAKLPTLLAFMVRRIGSAGTPQAIELLVATLAKEPNPAARQTIVRGLSEALKGRRQVAMPAAWPDAMAALQESKDPETRFEATLLAVTFGDAQAFATLRKLLADTSAPPAGREKALAGLLAAGDKELPALLQRLVGDPALRSPALRGLAAYDDPQTPAVILKALPSLAPAERRDALGTLAARPAYARALLDAVAEKKLAAADVPVDVVRQMRNFNDKALDDRLAEVWGVVRTTPADRLKLIADYRKKLTSSTAVKPDLPLGRAVFAKTCQQCHTLFGVGGKVGPDITGSNRTNLDYLLENILDPSAVIPKEYAASVIELKDGRFLTGIVRNETPTAFAVVLANETVTVSQAEVVSRQVSAVSMMPEGQLVPLSELEVRSLIAYLQSPTQTPILATADNAKDLFNGKDLTGWVGDPQLWKVESGEIVGTSPGIKKNEFLKSQMVAGDFRLTLKVKLTPDKENSGVQFRTEALADGEVKGPQADVGKGWWGKLYDENGRGILSDKSGEAFVRVDDWNEYEIVAEGSHIRTWINGKPCVDLDDPTGPRQGIFALQIHAGGPMEVRFKDLRLQVLPAKSEPRSEARSK
jgi:putative heme-binding domain-containing protein